MQIIEPYYEIMSEIDGLSILKHIEKCGRTCYKSEDKITDDSCLRFVKMIIGRCHESVLEHYSFTVRFVCDRGVSHELVRHRIASYSQESTRYCNYGKKGVTFIKPIANKDDDVWEIAMHNAETTYLRMIDNGYTPQEARAVLPNSLKTEVVMTANLREWRTVLKQRTSKAAHPEMRRLMIPLLKELQEKIPIVFDDIEVKE